MSTTSPPPRKSRTAAIIVVFALLCALVLALASGGPAGVTGASGLTLEDRVLEALRETRRAQQARIDANYGEIETHHRRLERILNDTLDEIRRD